MEGTPGKLGNDTLQERVREDIREFDSTLLSQQLTQSLIQPLVLYNHGSEMPAPRFVIDTEKPKNLKELVEIVEKLLASGLPISEEWMYAAFGIPPPGQDTVLNKQRAMVDG